MQKAIELIYSQQSSDFLKGRCYGNPRFFSTPRTDVSKVYLVGDWPKIRAAYEALGVPVEQMDAVDAAAVVTTPPKSFSAVNPLLTADERAAVEIPDGWRDLPWTKPAEEGGITLRGLGAKFSSGVLNREQAIAAVEAELERRANSLEMMRDPGLDVKTFAGEA